MSLYISCACFGNESIGMLTWRLSFRRRYTCVDHKPYFLSSKIERLPMIF